MFNFFDRAKQFLLIFIDLKLKINRICEMSINSSKRVKIFQKYTMKGNIFINI